MEVQEKNSNIITKEYNTLDRVKVMVWDKVSLIVPTLDDVNIWYKCYIFWEYYDDVIMEIMRKDYQKNT